MKINLSKFLRKLVAANGINFLIDQKAVGIGALLFSEEVGGYIDPDYIDGYTYNPQDGGWYKTPPAPAYGDNAWGGRASSEEEVVLNRLREAYIRGNEIEKRSPQKEYSVIERVWQLFWPARTAFPCVDPMALDLDGDGLETIGIDGQGKSAKLQSGAPM